MSAERLVYAHLMEKRTGGFQRREIPATTSFMTPSANPFGKYDADGGWIPPSPSTASRRPSARSKGSLRSFMVSHEDQREIVAESGIERDVAATLLADRRITLVEDQPPPVKLKLGDRKIRRTFDFRVTLQDGRRVAMAVKPRDKIKPSGIETVIELASQQVPQFADRFMIIDETMVTRSMGILAREILHARRFVNTNHVAAVQKAAEATHGTIRIRDLARLSGIGVGAWWAIIYLIGEEELVHIGNGMPTDRSFVKRAEK